MQLNENKTLHTITRHDGLKTVAFVMFCLVLSTMMLGGVVAMWFVF